MTWKSKDQTKHFAKQLVDAMRTDRENIDKLLTEITKYPMAANRYGYELATTHVKLRWRTCLFQYLIGSTTMEQLQDKLNGALREAAVDYRNRIKEPSKEEDAASDLSVAEFNIDYLIKATDREHSVWDYDRILENAEQYSQLDSFIDVFEIGQPLVFSDANTTDD